MTVTGEDVPAAGGKARGQIAQFTDQLMAGAMSQGGDSGSAVLDESNHLVGLLFAGSDTSTILNRIQNVFSTLSVSPSVTRCCLPPLWITAYMVLSVFSRSSRFLICLTHNRLCSVEYG